MNFRTESFDLPQKEQRRTRSGSSSRRSEEHTSELQSQSNLVCRLLLEKKNQPPRSISFLTYLWWYANTPFSLPSTYIISYRIPVFTISYKSVTSVSYRFLSATTTHSM